AHVACRCVHRGLHRRRNVRAGFEFETRHATISDSARDDPIEVAEVRRDVQCKAMGRDTLRDMHADGSDLLFAYASSGHGPDTGEFADALGHHAEVRAGANQGLFEHADVVDRTKIGAFFSRPVTAQIKDGIANQLSWAMIRNIAATVDL